MTEQEVREQLKVGSKVKPIEWRNEYVTLNNFEFKDNEYLTFWGRSSLGHPTAGIFEINTLEILPDESDKKYHWVYKSYDDYCSSTYCTFEKLLKISRITHYAKYVDCMLPTGELDESKLIEVKKGGVK